MRPALSRQPCERLLASPRRQLVHEGPIVLLGKSQQYYIVFSFEFQWKPSSLCTTFYQHQFDYYFFSVETHVCKPVNTRFVEIENRFFFIFKTDSLISLAILELDNLRLRRLRMNNVLAYKQISGLADAVFDIFVFRADGVTQGHDYSLYVIARNNRVNVRKWYFSRRLVNVSNNLPITAVRLVSLYCFKSFLAKAHLSAFSLLSFPLDERIGLVGE